MKIEKLKIICVAALLAIAGCASTNTHQAPGEYVDDSTITAKVKAALIADPTAEAHEIKVETFRGVVQLSGFVESQAERDAAVQVAQRVKGVKSVHDDLELKSNRTVGEALDDSVVTTKVKTALIDNPVTKARQINVATANGVVQLSGFVDSMNEKNTASEVARNIPGVRLVQNELETKPAP